VRLDDVQHEAGGDGGVERVPAVLQHSHRGLRGQPVRAGDHAEGAPQRGPGGEHAAEHTLFPDEIVRDPIGQALPALLDRLAGSA
jgi:hypothetical protein